MQTVACRLRDGRTEELDVPDGRPEESADANYAYPPPALALAGAFVAYGFDYCDVDACYSEVRVERLFHKRGYTGIGYPPLRRFTDVESVVGSVVVARNGAFAWIACERSDEENDGTRCTHAGRWTEVVASPRPRHPKVLARGRRIDPGSLRLRGRQLTFIDAGRVRDAKL
jgi:hypothetical protein